MTVREPRQLENRTTAKEPYDSKRALRRQDSRSECGNHTTYYPNEVSSCSPLSRLSRLFIFRLCYFLRAHLVLRTQVLVCLLDSSRYIIQASMTSADAHHLDNHCSRNNEHQCLVSGSNFMVDIVPFWRVRLHEYVYIGGVLITSLLRVTTRLPAISENIIFFGVCLLPLRVYYFCLLVENNEISQLAGNRTVPSYSSQLSRPQRKRYL